MVAFLSVQTFKTQVVLQSNHVCVAVAKTYMYLYCVYIEYHANAGTCVHGEGLA